MEPLNALRKWAETQPDRPAIVDRSGERVTTYGQLDRITGQIAARLQFLGCRKGVPVLIQMERGMEFTATILAAMKLGCPAVPLMKSYPDDRVRYIQENCQASLLADESILDSIETLEPIKAVELEDLDPVLILYTSGSTGKPKGVVYHASYINQCMLVLSDYIKDINPLTVSSGAPMTFIVSLVENYAPLYLGGCVHILPDAARKDIRKLEAYFEIHQITLAFISPKLLSIFHNRDQALKLVLTGSERVSNLFSQDFQILNAYGQTESSLIAMFPIDRNYENTPVGKVVANYKLLILDEDGQEVSQGADGEICVKGNLPRQYMNLPEQSLKTFVPCEDGEILLHTGDIGHVSPDGNLIYVNRKDWMVKINGQRVEPGEIEAVLKNQPGVQNAAVKDFTSAGGVAYLCGYYVSPEPLDEAVLREGLSHALPEYMIPAYLMHLTTLPVNTNGKLDRSALPAPDLRKEKAEYEAPTNETEALLCRTFQEILDCGTVGIHDDFFSLGADSIKTMELQNKCSLPGLTTSLIFAQRTPQAIAAALDSTREDLYARAISDKREAYPLTSSQMGVYLACLQVPDTLMYNIPASITIPRSSSIDADRLRNAVKTSLSGHASLCCRIELRDGAPVLVPREEAPQILCKAAENPETEKQHFVRPFDLYGTLYRAEILETPQDLILLLDFHHIIFDGTSMAVLLKEISMAYEGLPLPQEQMTQTAMGIYEELLPQTPEYSDAQHYFEDLLDGTEPADLIFDHGENTSLADKPCSYLTKSTKGLLASRDAEEFAARTGITVNSLLLGAFAYTFSKFTGSPDTLLTTVNHGRHDSRMGSSTGMYVRTLPLHLQIKEDLSVSQYLAGLQLQLQKTISHDCYPFLKLAGEYGLSSDYMFVYQSDNFVSLSLDGQTFPLEEIPVTSAQSKLSVMVFLENGVYRIRAAYRSDLFEESSMDSFFDTYLQVLTEFLVCQQLKDVALVSPRQLAMLDQFNETAAPYDASKTIIDRFREQAALSPRSTAVVCGDKRLTYAQLDDLSDRIACRLRKQGIGREDVVSILLPRCEYMPVAALGVSKAGAAYEPLDPSYPRQRLQFMMEDAKVKLLIADESLLDLVSDYDGPVLLTKDIPSLPDSGRPEGSPSPEDLFILLYTSGTTGIPKGVMLEHRNIAAFCVWYQKHFSMDASSRVSAYASFGFDANMMDTYPTLTCGAALYIIEEDIRLDLVAMNRYLQENKITHGFFTTQIGRALATSFENSLGQVMSVGGEALTPCEPPVGYQLLNGYGPTECTIFSTTYKVDRLYDRVPIGYPADNMKLYITDSLGRRLPPGAPGELCITGVQVGRGYLNRPGQNAFCRNPYSEDPLYQRMYHSGDVVRYLPDGAVDFIGRRDGQVKIRGFRIELPEVEKIIRQYPGIRDVAVVAKDAAAGGKYLAAYLVSDTPIDPDALGDFIRKTKPPYMVPAAIMQIDSIPLNVNGKVDKRKLPEITLNAEAGQEEEQARPMTLLEEKIHGIASQILGSSSFSVSTSLQKCGLSSLSVIKLAVELKKQFGYEADVKKMMKDCSVLSIENDLQAWLLEELHSPRGQEPVEAPRIYKDHYPLSASQFGVYADCMRQPESTKYLIPCIWTFPADFSPERLQAAVRQVLTAHPLINTHLTMAEDDICQICNGDLELQVPFSSKTETEFDVYMSHFVQPINMMKAPLFRIELVKTEKALYLMADFHHIIFDGGSLDLFGHQLLDALAGQTIPAETYNYFDYVEDQLAAMEGPQYQQAEEFFRNMLQNCESASEITPDCSGNEEEGGFGQVFAETDLPAAEAFSRELGVTPAALYLAASFYAVSRFVNSRNVFLSTISNGRADLRLADCFGMFVKTLPVGIEITNCTVSEFVKKAAEVFSGSMDHEIYPYSTICRNYGYGPSIVYEYQIGVTDPLVLDGKVIEARTISPDHAKFKTAIHIEDHEGKPSVVVIYNTALYSESLMHTLAKSVGQIVLAMAAAPDAPLRKVSMLDAAQKQQLDKFSVSCMDPSPWHFMQEAFEAQAKQHPDHTALIACDQTLTYGQLDGLANRTANALLAAGLKPGQRVIVLLNRHSGILISILGVLKAGGTYIPTCPEYPKERIASILKDCDASFIITEPELTDTYPGTVTLDALLSCTDETRPALTISPENLAYMIYTSGSTGKPKGVRIRHCGIANYLTNHPANMHIRAIADYGHVYGSVTTVSFDMWLKESFAALSNGLTLAFADDVQSKDPFALADFMNENHVDVFNATPSRLQQYLELDSFRAAIQNCHVILSGGEKYPDSLLKALQGLTKSRIINTYGPTEITVSSNGKELTKESEISIGRPLLGYREYIVDADDNPVPPGVIGELIICGIGVADGYHNLPDKTKEAFITYDGYRAYRSGDYARWTSQGDVVILGRKDHQVKLRGLRIELGEVEKALSQCSGIQQSLVMIRKLGREDALCAYYTAKEALDPEVLKAELGKTLTDYMVPSAFVQLDKMPMTFNGKIDRKALPEPQKQTHREGREPRTPREKTFCDIFSRILDLDKVYVDDNFFSLGGSSLTVTQVIVGANKAGISNIAYGDVFSHPTPESLAAFVTGEQESEFDSMADYDYTDIEKLLKKNNLDSFRQGQLQPLGDVLLTGATGFLGIHILYELLHSYSGKVYCPIRAASEQAAIARMNAQYFYYFEESLQECFPNRVVAATGDITKPCTLEPIFANHIDTVINCAANVKHFSKGTDIEDIDYYAVLNLISLCKKYNVRLIQTSTKSIAGALPVSSDQMPVYHENQLYIGQSQESRYTQAKFAAERAVLQEISAGMNAKIMRYGNLSARNEDGEFQINFKTNSFMGRVRANTVIGAYPYEVEDQTFEMSPIEYVARATLLLAQTPRDCTVFHVYNNHRMLMGDLCEEMNAMDLPTRPVEMQEYRQLLDAAKQDPRKAQSLTGLLAYENMDHGRGLAMVGADNHYTMQILYRMGFHWPNTSWDYMRRFLKALKTLEFFQ